MVLASPIGFLFGTYHIANGLRQSIPGSLAQRRCSRSAGRGVSQEHADLTVRGRRVSAQARRALTTSLHNADVRAYNGCSGYRTPLMVTLLLRASLPAILAGTFGLQLAHADIYTWVDASGSINVSNVAPPEGVRVTSVMHESAPAIAARAEAEDLIAATEARDDGVRVVKQTFEGRDAESLKKLAHALIARPKMIVLLGSRDKETARLVFARSPDTAGDMNVLMRDACVQLDGRGGGKPDMAQGGGSKLQNLVEAIDLAAKALQTRP